jgi:hypothetical protein
LYDYVARRYDPALGRFIQADTIVPEPGNPQSLNRYTYVYNNPLTYTDPSGHCTPLIFGAAGAVFGFALYALTTDSFDVGEALLATGTMAAAGSLIGTGVGAAAGAPMVAAALTGAGVGMVAGGGSEMLINGLTGQEFSAPEFAISAAGGAASGAITGLIPGVGLAPAVARSAASGGIGVVQYGAEQAVAGRSVDPGGALTAFSTAATGQMLGEVGTVALFGTPSARSAMTRLSPGDFPSRSLEFSLEFYRSNPDMKKLLESEIAIRAGGQAVRDALLNAGLGLIPE